MGADLLISGRPCCLCIGIATYVSPFHARFDVYVCLSLESCVTANASPEAEEQLSTELGVTLFIRNTVNHKCVTKQRKENTKRKEIKRDEDSLTPQFEWKYLMCHYC